MDKRISVNVIIEREKIGEKDVFIASSPDTNILAGGDSIDEAKKKFLDGLKIHLDTFPEEKNCLIAKQEEKYEMPMITRIFL
jgi:hypothetical protein